MAARGVLAERHLRRARTQLDAVRADIVAGDATDGTAALSRAAAEAKRAVDLTGDPVWHLASHLPLAGSSLLAAHGLALVASDLTTSALPDLLGVATQVNGTLRGPDGAVSLPAVAAAGDELGRAVASLGLARSALASLPPAPRVGAIGGARTQLLADVIALQGSASAGQRATGIALQLLGSDGTTRHFLVALQNPAEARGTGGLIGAYAILSTAGGRVTLDSVGSDDSFTDTRTDVVPLSPDTASAWAALGAGRSWRQANLPADLPSAARVWAALWQRQSGQTLDGVIALDPETTGLVLTASGLTVTTPDGSVLSGDHVPAYVESELYARYPTDVMARRAQLTTLVRSAYGRVTAGTGGTTTLLRALGTAAGQGRLAIWVRTAATEADLVAAGVSGREAAAPGPSVRLVVNNLSANKMDYYLDRTVRYMAAGCGGPSRGSTVDVTLHNGAPASGLPLYVAGHDGGAPLPGDPPGTERLSAGVFAAVGAQLSSAQLDGVPVSLETHGERGRPVFSTRVRLVPEQTAHLVLQLTEPTDGPLVIPPAQPLSRPEALDVATQPCLSDVFLG